MQSAPETMRARCTILAVLAAGLAGCGGYPPSPVSPAALTPERDSGFAIAVADYVDHVDVDTFGRFVRVYEPTAADHVSYALMKKDLPPPTGEVALRPLSHAWNGWRVVVALAPPGRYRVAALVGCEDDPYRSPALTDAVFTVEEHRITLVGSVSCVSAHPLFDTFPEQRRRAATLIAEEDGLGHDTDPMWMTWARATQLLR